MALALVLVLLVVGTVIFHFASPWWFTRIASNWTMVDDTVNLTFWVTGTVFIIVNLFLAYCVYRYRHRSGSGQKAHYEPESKKLEIGLTVITSIGIAAMLAPGLNVWAQFVTVPEDAAVVEVLGRQWSWSYRFPGPDGKLGATDARDVSVDNPFGMNPNDLAAQDDILVSSPELHLPLGKPVKFALRAHDVSHQFAVPQFRVKMDVVPGMVTHFWATPTRTGSFDALCEQLCGTAHFVMRGRVVVEEEAAFQKWLATQPTYSQVRAMVAGDVAAGQQTFAVCSSCHGTQGEGNPAMNAPKLAGQAAWYLTQQLSAYRRNVRGSAELDQYGKQMDPFAEMLADDSAIRSVAAYIGTLPDQRAAASISGDARRGEFLYRSCSGCHGAAGEGVWSTNAPRLAGMSDWYLVRQLQNFRSGARGTHPQDFSGSQMQSFVKVLADDKAINDVVAYVGTL
jgi:cytochrome c oxidase subunit 2